MHLKKLIFILFYFFNVLNSSAQTQMVEDFPYPKRMETFMSLDSLLIEADYYFKVRYRKGVIILCHQAGWSRGEYEEIAFKLIELGYDCLAIDLRSGGEVNEVQNITARRAYVAAKPTGFLDAEQDIIAAVRLCKRSKEPVILWGSSYSASLVLKVAQNEGVDKVLSFSPGEYFGDKMTLVDEIDKLDIPVFMTCSKKEIEKTQIIFDAIPSENKTFFKPKTDGNHGSRALWSKFDDSEDYWEAVKAFLKD